MRMRVGLRGRLVQRCRVGTFPARKQIAAEFDVHEIQRAIHRLIDDVPQSLRALIERGDGRHHDRPQLGDLHKQPERPR